MKELLLLRKKLRYEIEALNMLEEWICNARVEFTHAVTLTFAKKEIDRVVAERVFGLFLHYLNERIYRRAFKSRNKKLKVAAVVEGLKDDQKRLHYHFAIKVPKFVSDRRVREEIQYCWDKANKTRENEGDLIWFSKKSGEALSDVWKCGFKRENRIEVKPFSNNGWINYIAKEFNINNMDCISEHCYF